MFFTQLGSISEQRRTRREHGYQAWDYLKELQAKISYNGVYLVTTDDLQLKPDGLHLSAAAQVSVGKRFADMAWRTLYQHDARETSQ